MNRTAERKHREPNPISKASIFSQLTFWWMKPLFTAGLKHSLADDDIYEVPHGMRSDLNTEKYAKVWDEELNKKNPSMLRVIFKLHGLKVFVIGLLFSIAETVARVFQPLCLGGFVAYFAQYDDTHITLNDAYWYASGIVISTAFMIISFHPTILYIFRTSCKIRVACSGLMYRKALRLSKSSNEDGLNGKIINIISNDLSKIDFGLSFVHDLWKGPIEAITFFVIIYTEIGISAVIGMAFLASFIPLQAWIGKRSATLRSRVAKRTDFRVKIMNEILLGIQVIKMYAWERSFATMVDEIRKKEVNAIRSIAFIRATITSFSMISKISICLSLVSYVYLGDVITARKVFVVSSYFNILNLSMVYFWPVALTHVAEAYISVKRLQEFLLKDENKQCAITSNNEPTKAKMSAEHKNGHAMNGTTKAAMQFVSLENEANKDHNVTIPKTDNDTKTTKSIKCQRIANLNNDEKGIQFENASAAWLLNEKNKRGVFDINAVIKPGLCTIVGQVGSGKSTLLNVLLGELTLDSGSVNINGSISFASQEPWLFEGTVRDNILFVDEYDEQRYNDVVRVCALERDFKLMPLKDCTIVGERGVSLSGGQRARVNLARACYRVADIYLLDDPLSAVDAHVGKHIFEKCITDYLKDKICVLVTHQLQYLKNVQHVIVMNEGRIEAQGPFRTLERINKEALMHSQEDGNQEGAETFETRIKKKPSTSSFCDEEIENGANDRKELQSIGAVKFDTYKGFFATVRSPTKITIVFVMFVLAQILASGSDYFLKEWVDWEENKSKKEKTLNSTKLNQLNEVNSTLNRSQMLEEEEIVEERNNILIIYSVIMVVGTFFYLYRSFSFFNLCLRISINMHDMVFRGITRARMIFFNNNPSGRILNRFARDIGSIDSTLPVVLLDVIDFFLNLIAIMVIIGTVNFWLLIPTAILTILFYVMRSLYVNTGRSLKRIEALSRSPIYSHMNATLQGLSTVRVFNANKILENEFHEFQDQNTSSFYLYLCATRWFALWLDIVCLAYIAFVTYSFLFFGDAVQSGAVGLAILSSINLVGMCQWGMRQTAELENQMISVERIIEYAKLTPEPPLESDEKNAPPANWPSAGNIAFKALSLRYVENGPRILRGLTFNIESQQKIGIVGRTGAGKSSIIQAIFRLANNEGQILIDEVDIGVIGLHDLRKKISIIPQDPVLFSGSLRSNLDPFREKSDIELWNALEQVELKSIVSSIAGALDCRMSDGGSNFSVGQRQLVCLARAILRNNKILILDEATANVDPATDKLIQNTIQSKFANCTVMTIAHRLHTVMGNDKVLVMDAGEALEFAHPFELLRKSDGFFKRLVEQTGNSMATALTITAKENYDRMMHTKSS